MAKKNHDPDGNRKYIFFSMFTHTHTHTQKKKILKNSEISQFAEPFTTYSNYISGLFRRGNSV